MSPGEHPLRVAPKPRVCDTTHTFHQELEEIISQRIALKPRVYIHGCKYILSNIAKRRSVTDIRHGQLRRTTVPDYSGLRMATLDFSGLDYAGLLPDYSGCLRRPQGFSVPSPRTSLASGKLPTRLPVSPVPVLSTSTFYRIRVGFHYIQRRGLLPMLVCGLRSQATQS